MGVYGYDKAPPPFLRIQDKFLDYVRKYIVGSKMGKIKIIEMDKNIFLEFQFKTNHERNFLRIGYQERELFFAKIEKDLVYCSWNNKIEDMSSVVWPNSEWDKVFENINIEKYLEKEEIKSEGIVEQKKRERFLLKKIENIKKDLISNSNWNKFEELIHSGTLDFSLSELRIGVHIFKFVGLRTDWEKKDLIFKKMKKLKRGEVLLLERLKETEEELNQTKKGEFVKNTTKEKAIQILWNSASQTDKKNQIQSKNNFDEIKIYNMSGVIGLNSAGNDQMRKYAKKEHFWFHIENYSGAHCILKTDDSHQLSADVLRLVASILRDYSKLSILEIPLVFTQVKNVKGIKGNQGKVLINKAKHLTCPYRDWKEIIAIN